MAIQTATVWAPDGGKVKLRANASKDCNVYWNIPTGTQVDVVEPGEEWSMIRAGDKTGYMMTKYLIMGDVTFGVIEDDHITVERKRLEAVYDELGDILGMRG